MHKLSASFFNRRILIALSILYTAVLSGSYVAFTQYNALQNHIWYELAFQQLRDNVRVVNVTAYQLNFAPSTEERHDAEIALRQALINLANQVELIAATDSDGQESEKLYKLKSSYPWLFETQNSKQHSVLLSMGEDVHLTFPEELEHIWEDNDGETENSHHEIILKHTPSGAFSDEPLESNYSIEGLSFELLELGGQLTLPRAEKKEADIGLSNAIWHMAEDKIIPGLNALIGLVAQSRQENLEYMLLSLLVAATIILFATIFNMAFIFRPMQRAITGAYTQLAEQVRKAQSADQAKTTFLANMSHEIRTPINGILGMAQILERSDLSSRQKDFVRMLISSGKNLLVIINDVLDFSKIEAGKIELTASPVNLRNLVEEIITSLSIDQGRKQNVEIIIRILPTVPKEVTVDKERLRQVITNLFGNALKFTEKGHVLVELAGTAIDGCFETRLRVTDTGCGIPQDAILTLFDRFTQVDSEYSRQKDGTGLGLSICKQLVELMDGTIQVESQEDIGSTFSVNLTLPISDATSDIGILSPALTNQHVLVVEGNSLVRNTICQYLESWDLNVTAVSAPEKVITALETLSAKGEMESVLLILSLETLGHNNGEIHKYLKAHVKGNYQVIMLGDWHSDITVDEDYEFNNNAELKKPVLYSHLFDAVTLALSKLVLGTTKEITRKVHRDSSQKAKKREAHLTLLVDDNTMNCTVIGEMLSIMGVQFIVANNGQEAVELYKARQPNIVLMDVSMPIMDGIEAARAIRGLEEYVPETVIIALTAHATREDRERCMDCGMDDYLAKPVEFDDIEALYKKWVKQ